MFRVTNRRFNLRFRQSSRTWRTLRAGRRARVMATGSSEGRLFFLSLMVTVGMQIAGNGNVPLQLQLEHSVGR